ncbi:hypothetical protein [Aquibaculum arenosum]|uniref:Uncharacterized protein n=1 Tax=Aquibaculum arenosum TaxID=3032591 RepID=A0ABT5YK35_9PROT|nr:hypothetical protein [Fodinicurvata sp. CAU 1616]MDF2095186.1 hypothetical protein [Fodinicurvata sp. CAU 1616]
MAIHHGLLQTATRRQRLLCSAAAAIFALGAASSARAAPDACDLSSDTAVCGGDQSAGISGTVGGDLDPNIIETLLVQDLAHNIAPVEGGMA